jgi:P27 family predicted phage terminase small subunit
MRTKPRKPTKLRLIEGNRGHRPIPPDEPQPICTDEPQPPPWLSPYALEEWIRVAPEIFAMGILARIDEIAFAGYCECVSRWRMAEEVVRAMAKADPVSQGLLARMPSGALIQNPAIGAANKARRDMIAAAGQFGLTAASRAQLEGKQRDDGDPLATKYNLR